MEIYNKEKVAHERGDARSPGIIEGLVYLFERVLPDPFVLSVMLTMLVAMLALFFSPHPALSVILTSWYGGMFKIVGFAGQMILMLAAGYALAEAPLVRRGVRVLASRVHTPRGAALLVFPVVALAAWFNWGVGLVMGAMLSREIARNVRVDFAWLVAGSYSAWSVCNSGLSSPIPLSQASHGSALNLVEKATGHVVPLAQTVFAPFVYVPTALVVVVMTAVFIWMHPRPERMVVFRPDAGHSEKPDGAVTETHPRGASAESLAARAEASRAISLCLVLLGGGYLALTWSANGFALDIDATILILVMAGLAQCTPRAYADAIRRAAGHTGSMLLQYPLYGGIMGIMIGTGLTSSIAKAFTAVATSATLPLWSYVSSLIITLLVPSAGGHWAVQGPFVLPAALELHASVAHTAMAVAVAENVSNMLQPFWAVPLVAIAGIRLQRVMGYTFVTFVVSLVIYGAALWLA